MLCFCWSIVGWNNPLSVGLLVTIMRRTLQSWFLILCFVCLYATPEVVQAQELLLTLVSPNAQVEGRFGWSPTGISDVDGDGVDDFLIGAPAEDTEQAGGAGRAYVMSGATGEPVLPPLVSPNAVEIGRFGLSLAGVSDVDGDGADDFLISAPFEHGIFPNAGRVHIMSGATGEPILSLTSPNAGENGRFGSFVTEVSDIGSDGADGFLIGAPYEDAGFPDAGRTYCRLPGSSPTRK
jgi:hypothetical protein